MRLLFVEDHVGFRTRAIQEFLRAHEVTVASALADARRLLAAETFDAVLLDYDLPDGKGEELLAEIEHRGLRGQVVAVSSREENNARLLAVGASAAVSKMHFAEIAAVLERLVSQR